MAIEVTLSKVTINREFPLKQRQALFVEFAFHDFTIGISIATVTTGRTNADTHARLGVNPTPMP